MGLHSLTRTSCFPEPRSQVALPNASIALVPSSAQQVLILLEGQIFLDPGCLSLPLCVCILRAAGGAQNWSPAASGCAQSFLRSLGKGRSPVLPGVASQSSGEQGCLSSHESSHTASSVSLPVMAVPSTNCDSHAGCVEKISIITKVCQQGCRKQGCPYILGARILVQPLCRATSNAQPISTPTNVLLQPLPL